MILTKLSFQKLSELLL